ncbi:hypothetical protein STRDD11_00595 [Streptococcus sp. DD11]|nr:hypothetical protein STRDD11_00595 [Streptococcus sp. DD11]
MRAAAIFRSLLKEVWQCRTPFLKEAASGAAVHFLTVNAASFFLS